MTEIFDKLYEVKSRIVNMFLYKADHSLICFDTGFNEGSIKKSSRNWVLI